MFEKSDNNQEGLAEGELWPEFRLKRLEMPIFDGENPKGWLFRSERYFSVNMVWEPEKLEAVVVCVDEGALTWYQWAEGRQPFKRRSELKMLLVERFGSSQASSPTEQLFALQ